METWFSESARLAQEILWGVPLWRFLEAVLIIFVGFLSRRVIAFIFGNILKRRVEKIEQKLEPEKGPSRRIHCSDGSFIEVPDHLTLIDLIAMCGGIGEDEKLYETERK